MTKTEVLKKYFGYDNFRSGQEDIIHDILSGLDVLAIMPTGAGKSICFQVPAVMKDGITLVISPLISLMKDQVGALTQAGIPAAYLNSTLTALQMERALQRAENGQYKLIYVAPERLLSPNFLAFANKVQIDMVTIDEAHCISQWGQDFRPGYLQIPQFIASLAQRPIVSAFTATATLQVKEDIMRLLEMHMPAVYVMGFDRENLYYEVQAPKSKMLALMEFIQENKEKYGIIYCGTRKKVESVSEALNRKGISASRYHAGLSEKERHNNQDDFLYDRVQIMVATNAFGMGIDKSNVSFVLHYDMPKDVESYYQEAGRSGRDGTPAKCLLLYSPQDVQANKWMIENGKDASYPDAETERVIKERDYLRLKQMTFYATTNDCLRNYILRYFGESAPGYCGNCSNCNTKFETIDITIDAKKILSCVHRMGGRYGMMMLIDVLRGSKNERIEQLGLNQLSTYGICEKSVKSLRSMMEHLVLTGYLEKTDGQYAVIKLTPASREILYGNLQLEMKMAKEKVADKKESGVARKDGSSEVQPELYQQLKNLRKSIASEQGVPAFVIFSDKTLQEMCTQLPQTEMELLHVNGVGDVKQKRYGERFLSVLRAFAAQ